MKRERQRGREGGEKAGREGGDRKRREGGREGKDRLQRGTGNEDVFYCFAFIRPVQLSSVYIYLK